MRFSAARANTEGLTVTFAARGARWFLEDGTPQLKGAFGFQAVVNKGPGPAHWVWAVIQGYEEKATGVAADQILAMQRACRAMKSAGG